MGARIEETAKEIVAESDRLHGARIVFDLPTVTGTENILLAAVLAEGRTEIFNAAREPHVQDLCLLLGKMGARIEGIGTERLVVDGVRELGGAEHAVVADYLEAGTYAIAVAVKPIDMSTWTYPGFPTDLQAQYMALMTQAEGETVISEYVHENRFQHVTQLAKMGAGITVEGRLHAVVHGPCRLRGTEVSIPDIRSGAALVIAALCAEGQSVLRNAWHVERGYEDMAGKLASVGAQIEKVSIDSDGTGTERTYE